MADVGLLRGRVHSASRYDEATGEEQQLIEKFLARANRYQSLMLDAIDGLRLDCIDVGAGRRVDDLADAVLDAVVAQVES